MEYAIVESGGKQYKAVVGETIDVDRLPNEAGDEVELKVLLSVVDNKVNVGTPYVPAQKSAHKLLITSKALKS
jgi:large subunit ribosomal protein L21